MRTRLGLLGLFILPLVLLISSTIYAQPSACETLIHQAFDTLSQTCGDAGGSSACFGNSASAAVADGAGSFAQPGDRLDLSVVQSIRTLPLDTNVNQWGLAMLNVQANVPLALSTTGLRYVMVGDTEIANAVAPENAFQPVQPITVTPLVAANLRSGPSTDAQVLVSAPVGTELLADALNADGAWLRVLNQGETSWVSRQIVAAKEGDIGSLPNVNSDTRTLMQSFYLRTNPATPECTNLLPSMLIIQAPPGLNATITVNGVNIRFSGVIALRVTADNNLQLFALSGGASTDGVSVPAGFTLYIPLVEGGREAAALATGLRPVNDEERTFLKIASGEFESNLLYAPITIPTADQIAAMLVQLNSAVAGQTTSGPASSEADCSRFKPTSPLGSLAFGVTPFYWDGASGATSYRLNVYGEGGDLRGSFDINGNNTTLSIDTAGGIGDGSTFAWDVQALVNGQVACSTGRVSLPRDAASQIVGGGGGGAVATPTSCTWSC